MSECFEFILIQLKDPLGKYDGNVIRDVLLEKYDIEKNIHYTAFDRVIIALPEEYGVELGVSMNDLRKTVNNIAEATIYSVAVNVDFAEQKITTIYIS